MSWTYDPQTQKTDERNDPLHRNSVEEAVQRLYSVTTNVFFIEDVIRALTGLSKGEVHFNVQLVLGVNQHRGGLDERRSCYRR